jgi:hypothetical protein
MEDKVWFEQNRRHGNESEVWKGGWGDEWKEQLNIC